MIKVEYLFMKTKFINLRKDPTDAAVTSTN